MVLPNPRGPALSMPLTSSGIMQMSVKQEPDMVKAEQKEETGAEDEGDDPISLSKIMIDLGLPDFLHPVVCTVLKAKDPETTDASLITFLQAKELTDALPKEIKAGEETVELSLMDIAAVRKWHHDVCKAYKDWEKKESPKTKVSVMAPPVEPPAPSPSAGRDNYLFSDYLAQGQSGSFKLLSVDQLVWIRANFKKVTGAKEHEQYRPSDQQLSALSSWTAASPDGSLGLHPFVDFAIWGPYNSKAAKKRSFTSLVPNRFGELEKRQFKGPQSFEEWECCWMVFRTAMISLGLASPGDLDAYYEGIRALVRRYPTRWAAISEMDTDLRGDGWDRMGKDLASGSLRPSPFSEVDYVPETPWSFIIASSRYGSVAGPRAEWWTSHKEILDMVAGKGASPSSSHLGDVSGFINQPANNGKGQGKGKGKPHAKGAAHDGGFKCRICGSPDHFPSECPKKTKGSFTPNNKGGKGKKGKGKGKGKHKGGKGKPSY